MGRLLPVVFALVAACAATALDRVDETRREAERGPREAQAFAAAVVDAWKRGEYADEAKAFARDSAQALDLLARSGGESGETAATSIGWRALILRAQGHEVEAAGELERSFALAPNAVAGEPIVLMHGERRDSEAVGRVCAALCPVIADADERLRMVGVCRQAMHAQTAEEETRWMSPALTNWYRDELVRREEEAKRRAEEERRAKLLQAQVEQCHRACAQEATFCKAGCQGDVGCRSRCSETGGSCQERCNTTAHGRQH